MYQRLNVSSANSLLKILEEAPSHAVFILVARDTGSVLPTVLSRSEIVRFAVPSHHQARQQIALNCDFSVDQAAVCYALSEGRFGQSLEISGQYQTLVVHEGIRNSHADYLLQLEALSLLNQTNLSSATSLDQALRMASQLDQIRFLPLQAARKAFCRSLVMNTGLPAAFALMFADALVDRLDKAVAAMKKSLDPVLAEARKGYPSPLVKESEGQLHAAIDRWLTAQLEELFFCLMNWYADALLLACGADETLLLNLDRKEDIITLAKVEGIALLRARIEMLDRSIEMQRRYVQPLLILENLLTQIGGPEA